MSEPFDLNKLISTVLVLDHDKKKMLFKNNRSRAQSYYMTPDTPWVCDFHIKHSYYDIQVAFPLLESHKYNLYLVHIYVWKQKKLYIFGIESGTKYPPVWDRAWAQGPDYVDYVFIQHRIRQFLKSQNLPLIDVDYSLDGKSFNGTKQNREEIENLIKDGKTYDIVSINAEKMPELRSQLLQHFASELLK